MAAETFMTEAAPRGGDLVRRHRLSTRIWHWANAAILLILLMSGLMIFNAHPRLYWGQYGANPDPAWLEITAVEGEGITRIGGLSVTTTGVLGRWRDAGGQVRNRAFPGWATLPSSYNLALARRWHLTFAWALSLGLLIYAVLSLVNGHLRRDLLPRREELSRRHVWRDIRAHATLNFPKGRAALRYNILQKGSYLLVIFGLIPAMVLTGLTMSPAVDAAWPWLLDLFGGRQSARSIHFIAAVLLVAFVIVHLVMVLLAGPFNEIRSMITGRFRLPKETR
ncbi:cytochrome b/b6 domain-containing protein [Tranquillimonas rosea]|uniref:cytochrome b/b6 domain-containing protein n=1 Tax=Tranquillimonas rosea TaxID=641238 RepID=UPI003BAAA92E